MPAAAEPGAASSPGDPSTDPVVIPAAVIPPERPVYPPDSVGAWMEPPFAVLSPDTTVAETVEELRQLVREHMVTYVYVVDRAGRILGVVAMRELVLARPGQRLRDIMLPEPFVLHPETPLLEAMRQAVGRHFPVYPVCDSADHLVGLIRGQTMFERQAIEISAQPGQMVGVRKDETITTPWLRCWRLRYPWLQFNLVTALLAGSVIALFQPTLDRLVILAVFLPVLAGQSGNTGGQAMAVTLRGLTLGEVRRGRQRARKEALLGLANGITIGVVAGLAMYLYASAQGEPNPLPLAAVVFGAMAASCVISGVIGAMVPLALRHFGADPATASSIFLTTATDVVSIGLLLGLSTWLVL